jgi:hypothetical protein
MKTIRRRSAGSIALNAETPAASTTIATVSDVEDSAGCQLSAACRGHLRTGITNTSGTVTAMVSASCTATAGVNNVILQVIDSEGATTNATFVVTVTATPTPAVPTINGTTNGTGTADQACPEQPLTLTATSAGATSYQWYSDNSPISGARNASHYRDRAATYSVTATNNCGTSAASGYVVQNPTPNNVHQRWSDNVARKASAPIQQRDRNPVVQDGVAISAQAARTTSPLCRAHTQPFLNAPAQPDEQRDRRQANPPRRRQRSPRYPTTFCAGDSVTLTSSSSTGNQHSTAPHRRRNRCSTLRRRAATTPSQSPTAIAAQASHPRSWRIVNPIPPTDDHTRRSDHVLHPAAYLTSSSADGNQWFLNAIRSWRDESDVHRDHIR